MKKKTKTFKVITRHEVMLEQVHRIETADDVDIQDDCLIFYDEEGELLALFPFCNVLKVEVEKGE